MTMTMLAIETPIGTLRLFDQDGALAGLHLPSIRHGNVPAAAAGRTPLLERAATQLAEYFAGERRVFELPLAPRGTPFQERVWSVLREIPCGVTWSYADLARAIGQPTASRAVGAANGKNPIAIVIPCHRVIGASGALVGFGGGIPTKRWLLEHEQAQRMLLPSGGATVPACSGS
jgi:methylated-DNA-[protein]-cysteine S-methyltransferase